MTLQIKHTPVLTKNLDALSNQDLRFIFNQGGSRCHAPGTLIRMYDGTLKKVEDIRIGDKVASYDGLSYNVVTDTHSGVDDMYLIQQGKGDDYIVNRNHILVLKEINSNDEITYDNLTYISAEDWSNIEDDIRTTYGGLRIIDDNIIKSEITSTHIGKGDYYGFTLDKNPLYKLKDGTITHNSSKTHSLCQLIIIYCLRHRNKVVSIVRKTFPTLRSSVMRDFFNIMKEYNLYNENSHNKTENTYTFDNGSMVEFFSCDNEQKLRGRKRDLLWINEANELFHEDFFQLNIRTTEKVFFDFNPSFYNHWIYEVMERENSTMIHSTYKDNPFLDPNQIKEIEDTKNSDEDYYTIFALGQRAFSKENVFKKWDIVEERPEELNETIYAIDFGYTHPTAVVQINYNPKSKNIYIKELLYESYLTSQDIINRLNELNIDKTWAMVADYARPEIIQDMKRNGYNMVNAIKDVRDGIMAVKYFNVMISKDSPNIENENLSYKYKKVNGVLTEEPSKINDDLMDCFTRRTLVTTQRGLVPIVDVIPYEDYALTSNGYKLITDKFSRGNKQIHKYKLSFNDLDVYLESTDNHLIKTNEGWIEISKLKSGMILYHTDKNIKTEKLIDIVELESWEEEAFDISIDGEHEFFANGVLVHNCIRYGLMYIKKHRLDSTPTEGLSTIFSFNI